jgi:hypothetical protein
MIVLDPYQARLTIQFFQNDLSKSFIDLPISFPIFLVENNPVQSQMTERPEKTVRITMIILLHLLRSKPDPPQSIRRTIRWNPQTISFIHNLPIGFPTAPGHPDPIDRFKQWIQRRRNPSHRVITTDLSMNLSVDIRLPVGDHDEPPIRKFLLQELEDRLGR